MTPEELEQFLTNPYPERPIDTRPRAFQSFCVWCVFSLNTTASLIVIDSPNHGAYEFKPRGSDQIWQLCEWVNAWTFRDPSAVLAINGYRGCNLYATMFVEGTSVCPTHMQYEWETRKRR